MKLTKVADFYDDHARFFDSHEEVPTREKLIYLAQRRDHPEIGRLIEASVGTAGDWRATKKEVVEGKEP